MTQVYNKIFVQAGPTGDYQGWQQTIDAYGKQGIPVYAASSDSMTLLFDIQQLYQKYKSVYDTKGTKPRGNFIATVDKSGKRFDFDTNIYANSEIAKQQYQLNAKSRVQKFLQCVPPELDPEIITISIENEQRPYVGWGSKDDPNSSEWQHQIPGFTGWADSFGWQAYYTALELLETPYLYGAFAFAGGNPEAGYWSQPGVVQYLTLCEQYQGKFFVQLHEYSFTNDLQSTSPYNIGRFLSLFETCDQLGIARPDVEFKEFGWRERWIPDINTAKTQINWVNQLYCKYPEIKGAAIWTGQTGWDINNMPSYITWLAQLANQPYEVEIEQGKPIEPPTNIEDEIIFNEDFNAMAGWYDVNSIQQCRHGWTLETNDAINPETQKKFNKPEALFRWDRHAAETNELNQWHIPDHEAGILTNENGFCYKIFAAYRDWNILHTYDTPLEPGIYRFELTYFDDNFVDYVNGKKVAPPDPLSFTYRIHIGNVVTDWQNSNFLQENNFEIEFELQTPAIIGYEMLGRWGLMNVGVFIKNITLTKLAEIVEPTKPKIVVVKFPQELDKNEWLKVADYAFDDYRRTMTSSTDDMLTMLANGNSESYAKVYQPQLPSQIEAINNLTTNNFNWQELVLNTEPEIDPNNPLKGIKFGHIFDVPYVITSHFNDPREYTPGVPAKHEGTDYDVIGTGDSKAGVLCIYDGVVDRVYEKATGYGKRVVVKHQYNGVVFYTWYGHLDAWWVNVNDPILKGQPVGEVGKTGTVTGEHVHLTIQVPDYGLAGYVLPDVINPEPLMPNPNTLKPTQKIDLLDFMLADPTAWRVVRHPDGQQEDFRDYNYGNKTWAMVKSGNAEWWSYDDNYIYLKLDNSPAPQSDGTPRFYVVNPGQWCRRKMAIGENFNDGGHWVQFYNKVNCQPLSENSGNASNDTTLFRVENNYTFNTYGQNLTLDQVLFIGGGVETQVFARHQGKALGRVAWFSQWGNSEIVELHFDRGVVTNPPNRPCGF